MMVGIGQAVGEELRHVPMDSWSKHIGGALQLFT